MLNVAIILGSTRPGRNGETVAKWVYEIATRRADANYELLDIKHFNLPLLDEPIPPSVGQYSQPHTKQWAAKVAGFDAFVFVTPEYNHGVPGALKNAIDFLFREWNHKSAGFVSYGGYANGARAVEQLRLVMAELHVADVRVQVMLSLFTDFENFSVFKPDPSREASVNAMLDEVLAWGGALQTLLPGSFIQVDESRNQVSEGVWRSEYERPIYFVETRNGHICCWCTRQREEIILELHPLSPVLFEFSSIRRKPK